MRTTAISATLLLLGITSAAAQEVEIYDSGGPLSVEQAAFDVTFYELDLAVTPAARTIAGSATTTARLVSPLRDLVLDLDTLLAVSRVVGIDAGSEQSLAYQRRGGRLWIDLGSERPAGSTVAVRVEYAGAPRVAPRAPWDGGFVWSQTPGGAPWVATAVQGHGPDVWWPSKDHVSDKPDSMAIRIRVPEPLVVATNGRLREVESHADSTRTYHWFVSTPISAYNVALNIAPYEQIEEEFRSVSGETFPVVFYHLAEDSLKAREFFPEILEHLSFFERYLGPYPFRADKYGVAQTPHLGMEHQTIIAYGANFNNGAMTGGRDWGFDALHHHELAHEWFGNLVTNEDWKDMWLHEGFGTYLQPLYAEEIGGPDLYRSYLLGDRRMIANAAPLAPRDSKTAGEIYFDSGSDIYGKGSWVLHTLRYLIGDEAFFLALRRMAYPDPALESTTNGSHVRFVTTDDFLRIAEEVSRQDLGWFFEVYVRQAALPRLIAERNGSRIRMGWDVPAGLPFPMPVEIEVGGGRQRILVPASGFAEASVPGGVVVVDPDYRILRANQAPIELPG